MHRSAIIVGAALVGCGAPAAKEAPLTKPAPAAPTRLHATQPTVIDSSTLARMIAGPTDWSSFVSPTRGVVAWKGDYIDRYCGEAAATELATLVATMRGATCESSTEQSLCETANPTHIVQFIHEDGRWFGYGITYGEPNDLSDRERRVFDPFWPHATCEPMHHAIDWNSYTPVETTRRQIAREREASARPAPTPPPGPPEPTARQFDAAPNILRAGKHGPTHGCVTKYVDGYLQIRCPLAGAAGHGLFDTGGPKVGRLDVTSSEVTWTVKRSDMSAFGWWFDTGIYELASSATSAQWVEEATYKPGVAALLRTAMTCCTARHPAAACVGQGLPSAASTCKAQRGDCAAFDACMQRELAARK